MNTEDIAYCGLCCEKCFLRKGEIAGLAKELRRALREEKFAKMSDGMSKFFKELRDYDACYLTLGAMVKLRCNKNCREGGGNPFCNIRKCCVKKGYDGCWECDEFEHCTKFSSLKEVHGDANVMNLKNIKKKGKEGFLEGKIYSYL